MSDTEEPKHAALLLPVDEEGLEYFLGSYAPSAHPDTDDGWIWCHKANRNKEIKTDSDLGKGKAKEENDFLEKGFKLKKELEDRVKEIEATAPVRGKKGVPNQKQLREEAHAEFKQAVRELAAKNGVTSGKWLWHLGEVACDAVWGKIVRSMNDGPLSKLDFVRSAKIATSTSSIGQSTVPLCLYCDDSYDKSQVEKCFRTLVLEMQMAPSSYKTDAFTLLDIDSKHVSKIKSSEYTATTFMSKEEIDEHLKKSSKAKEAKKKSAQQEASSGLALADDDDSDGSQDEQPRKKQKKQK